MIITRAPFRVSLWGGSTDYEDFYSKYGSLLVGFTINKYLYVCLRKNYNFFDYGSKISYSHIEEVASNDLIKNPGIRGTLQHLKLEDGVSINIQSDLPARTGIGSSSALSVALAHAIYVYQNRANQATSRQLAKDAIYIERKLLNEPGGIQDQIWSAYGGVNSIQIYQEGDFSVRPLAVSPEFLDILGNRMVICYTGEARDSFGIAESHQTEDNHGLKKQLLALAGHGRLAFDNEDVDQIGRLLDKGWRIKRHLSSIVSNDYIDNQYDKAMELKAIGGKLLGSGGSGFFLFVLHRDADKQQFIQDLGLQAIDFDFSYGGSQLLLK